MNAAHAHLLLNHFPVIGMLVALSVWLIGLKTSQNALCRVALGWFVVIGAVSLLVYFSGNGAEAIVESLPEASRDLIEVHERWGLFSLLASLAGGALAAMSLWQLQRAGRLQRALQAAVTGLAGLSLLLAGYAGYWGGQIRHSEIRADFTAPAEDRDDRR
ncbi:MAG: hypothetical protein IPK79_04985 [Vampirovibrionales bacterium]|nr:hypothetical protein [Vampirovibrionales bacterium]